jgi:hypothetical protein
MCSLLSAIYECLTKPADFETATRTNGKTYHSTIDHNAGLDSDEVASEFINALFSAEKKGHNLEKKLEDIVKETGWTENIATAILSSLEAALRNGMAMGQAMKEAVDKATKAAVEFASDHPIFCTIIALGILALLAPWAIEALGFGELGPIEGTLYSRAMCVWGYRTVLI